jgi:hypothetical protein
MMRGFENIVSGNAGYRASVRLDGADDGPRRSLTIAHPLALGSKCSKKKKKTSVSLLLPPLHHIALRLPLRPSHPER